jgi:hypothetical protein
LEEKAKQPEYYRSGDVSTSYDLKEVKESPQFWSASEIEVQKLHEEVITARQAVTDCENRLKTAQTNLEDFESSVLVILKTIRKSLDDGCASDIMKDLKLYEECSPNTVLGAMLKIVTERAITGNSRTRIPPKLIEFGLAVYAKSKSAYLTARQFIPNLPSIDTILRHRSIDPKGDLTFKNIQRLVNTADERKLNTNLRQGGFLVDEMNVQCVSLDFVKRLAQIRVPMWCLCRG